MEITCSGVNGVIPLLALASSTPTSCPCVAISMQRRSASPSSISLHCWQTFTLCAPSAQCTPERQSNERLSLAAVLCKVSVVLKGRDLEHVKLKIASLLTLLTISLSLFLATWCAGPLPFALMYARQVSLALKLFLIIDASGHMQEVEEGGSRQALTHQAPLDATISHWIAAKKGKSTLVLSLTKLAIDSNHRGQHSGL